MGLHSTPRMAAQYDAKSTDPPLLQRNSEIRSFSTPRATYDGVRVFYRKHPQADKLPQEPSTIPLLVFIHGLGGSVAQFNSLLTSLTPIASCLAVDLPGCGVSDYKNTNWDAYNIDVLAELLESIINHYLEIGQRVVLIGHSMGASLAALLACPRAEAQSQGLNEKVLGLVAICPNSGPKNEAETRRLRTLLRIPGFLFDLFRAWDRRGGLDSPSVHRFVGADADPEAKRLQYLYNCQSRTPVFRRMAWGALPTWRNGRPGGGMPGEDVWSRLKIPVFLIGGEGDSVCPPEEVDKIANFIRGNKFDETSLDSQWRATNRVSINGTAVRDPESTGTETNGAEVRDTDGAESEGSSAPVTPAEPAHDDVPALSHVPSPSVRTSIFPKPATHALLYTPSTAPILAGLISDFLAEKVTGRLALAWQLQYLCRDGKWDVKNLEKWKSVTPVSKEIGGIFHAIKTLREVDEVHCPREFVKNWGEVIGDVVDISHDNPVYDPAGLEAAGIKYHKFPTVSKVPPTDVEVKGFIELVDKIRTNREAEGYKDSKIGVHCHYGFNRTGFLIVSYLVERCGFTPIEAIEHFAQQRPNGIRHAHFKDRLCVRYSALKAEGQ